MALSAENENGTFAPAASPGAIDNKIEQAMDLVKTHLLYAVREEVELLKERIVELETKINRLESENKILRKYAPIEILQFLQQQIQLQEQEQTHTAIQQQHAISPVLSAPTGQLKHIYVNILQNQPPQASSVVL